MLPSLLDAPSRTATSTTQSAAQQAGCCRYCTLEAGQRCVQFLQWLELGKCGKRSAPCVAPTPHAPHFAVVLCSGRHSIVITPCQDVVRYNPCRCAWCCGGCWSCAPPRRLQLLLTLTPFVPSSRPWGCTTSARQQCSGCLTISYTSRYGHQLFTVLSHCMQVW
jgi:hypothetical protein